MLLRREIGALLAAWGVFGLALVGATLLFQASVPLYLLGPGLDRAPIWELVALLALAGLVHAVVLPRLVRVTEGRGEVAVTRALVVVLASGLAARLVLLPGPVMLDDDVHRYLWDGAVVAHGHNPYLQTPAEVASRPRTAELGALAATGRPTLDVINHPNLTTLYPPVAQLVFATAHALMPFSLTAWRIVVLVLDLILLAGLLALARDTGRSPLWVVLYWWHPVALKELAHAGHMEAVLLPLVVWAVVLAGRGRLTLAVVLLAAATATKLWPALLLPVVLRPVLGRALRPTLRAIGLAVLFGILTLALLAPMLLAPFGAHTGIVAYASHWTTNSALAPALERGVALATGSVLPATTVAFVARGLLGLALGLVALRLAWPPLASPADLARRAAFLVAAIVLLSPAQFPWYTIWFAPLLVVAPFAAMRAIAVTVPLYYASFWFAGRSEADVFAGIVVWAIWLPVWAVLAWSVWRRDSFKARSVTA